MDLPGFGCSEGELSFPEGATVPAFAEQLGLRQYVVVGPDIGGTIAQHLAAESGTAPSGR